MYRDIDLSSSSLNRYAEKRPWKHWAAIVTIAVLVIAAFYAAEWDFSSLTNPDDRKIAFARMLAWLTTFSSPDFSPEFLKHCWALTLQTLSAATLGITLAVILATLLALGSSRSVIIGEEKAQGWMRFIAFRSPSALLCSLCRLVQDILRAIPDFVWAVILVAVIGLGPLTGALALALNITGILAKVYSEVWDNIEERSYEQVRILGGGRLATLFYGIGPLAARTIQSFTLMRAECAIRNAAVIGAVGGGGLGADIWYQIQFGAWPKVTTLMIFTLALTLSADLASNFIRRQLRSDPNHPRVIKSKSIHAQVARPYIGILFALSIAFWSVWFMGYGDNAPPGQQSRNYLEPAIKLVSTDSWKNLSFFERLVKPDFDLETIGLGDQVKVKEFKKESRTVDLFSSYRPWEFWKPSAWVDWEQEMQKWFVWRVIKSSAIPLAMAIVGTLLGVIGAILLSYPHSLAFMLESSQFTGETHPWWIRGLRFGQLAVAKGLGLVSRGVPDVMWAFLFIAFFGPGLVAGTLAIAIHSLGVLVRVFSESVDNIPYRRFEQAFMGARMSCYGYTAGPICWRDWMTYSFFQFESNVRTAVVFGIVGIGGLGFFFTFNFEWFRLEKAGTYLLMIIALTIIIDRISRALNLARKSC
ncbi:PhnE/PtxC family ABC transporter permease [Desulfonatronovibrio hydrogenovorans]|uniref:PhnE/PtxC family ABC transporter permease n=1 Tax=Desulfonatronovibrio hydrogenovorans TaxID=53245 RepID=UPI00048D781D|nr:ABC transporter permease subunit [Desulfonatronovibrio hydrogenovorans]